MSLTWASTVRLVEDRAQGRCEYCRMSKILQRAAFHVEYTTPTSKGGTDDLENLAWSCGACNLSKSNRTHLIDPETGQAVPIFNPRTDSWEDHFVFEGYRLVGRTAVGRALVAGLDLNDFQRLLIRQVEHLLGLSS